LIFLIQISSTGLGFQKIQHAKSQPGVDIFAGENSRKNYSTKITGEEGREFY
jgi:hypothetical protein